MTDRANELLKRLHRLCDGYNVAEVAEATLSIYLHNATVVAPDKRTGLVAALQMAIDRVPTMPYDPPPPPEPGEEPLTRDQCNGVISVYLSQDETKNKKTVKELIAYIQPGATKLPELTLDQLNRLVNILP